MIGNSANFPVENFQFLLIVVLTLAMEAGGVIALQVMQIHAQDILKQAWLESNLKTKTLVEKAVSYFFVKMSASCCAWGRECTTSKH